MKTYLVLPVLLASVSVSANEYQSFTEFNYLNVESSFRDYDVYSLYTTHYFSGKEALGPLNEFEFINRSSLVNALYQESEGFDGFNIGGEYHAGNFLLGARFAEADSFQSKGLTLGYFFSDDLVFSVVANDSDNSNTNYVYTLQYNQQLDGKDYIGYSLATHDGVDDILFRTSYFTALENGSFFKADFSLFDSEYTDYWDIKSSYYFNEMTSAFIRLNDDETYEVGAMHYLNDNWAVSASYTDVTESDETSLVRLGITAQF